MENKKFEVKGLKETINALKNLPADFQAKALKGFLSNLGRKFIVNELKTVLHYSKKTESAIKVVSDSNNKLSVSAGVTSKAFPLRWTDLGTNIRTGKKGENKGQIIGRHQIQPVIERQVEPAAKYAEEEMANWINESLKRRLKKFNK